MTKRELLEHPAFKKAKDDAQLWIECDPDDDCSESIPYDAWVFSLQDGTQNLIIKSRVPEDAWQTARKATKTLNAMNLGIKFYGNLFPYLRKRGKLPLCCKKQGHLWLYETDEIAWLVKNGKLDYKPR